MSKTPREPSANTATDRGLLERSVAVLREEGLRGFWFRALGETCYRRVLILERLLTEPAPVIEPRVPVSFGRLTRRESRDVVELRPESPLGVIERQLDAGEICFTARDSEGRLVCINWAATGTAWMPYLGKELHLAADEAYLHDSFTTPELRGSRIAPALAARVIEHFRDAGYRRLMTLVLPENRANLRARERAGYRVCGLMGAVGLGPWRHQFVRSS